MHKRGIIRYANYTVCASVFIHFCMQRKNNENIPKMTKACNKVRYCCFEDLHCFNIIFYIEAGDIQSLKLQRPDLGSNLGPLNCSKSQRLTITPPPLSHINYQEMIKARNPKIHVHQL